MFFSLKKYKYTSLASPYSFRGLFSKTAHKEINLEDGFFWVLFLIVFLSQEIEQDLEFFINYPSLLGPPFLSKNQFFEFDVFVIYNVFY
jgi:hypothetical protein